MASGADLLFAKRWLRRSSSIRSHWRPPFLTPVA
jgi:hypothetical protein